MTEVSEEQIVEAVQKIKEAFADGFQLEDIATVIKEGAIFAEAFQLSGEGKRALALQLIERVIEETDTPWIPDALVDPLLKRLAPKLVDLVVDASAGKLAINAGKDANLS